MTKNTHCLSLITAALTIPLLSASALAGAAIAHVEFSVRATMHTVKGNANAEPFEAVMEDAGDDTLLSFSAKAPVRGMKTGDEKRDEEMYHVLKEDIQPEILASVTRASLAAARPGETEVGTLPLSIQMAGVTNEIEAAVTDWEETGESLTFNAEFVVSQLAFEMKPIRKMGFLKVADPVNVTVTFTFEK